MARYFKIIEIDADTFIDATGDDLNCCQLISCTDGTAYVAIDEDEFQMEIPLDCFD